MSKEIDEKLAAELRKRGARRTADAEFKKTGHHSIMDPDLMLQDALVEAQKQHKSIKLPGKLTFPEDWQAALANPAGGMAQSAWLNPGVLLALEKELWPTKPKPPAPGAPSASAGPGAAAPAGDLAGVVGKQAQDPMGAFNAMIQGAGQTIAPDPNNIVRASDPNGGSSAGGMPGRQGRKAARQPEAKPQAPTAHHPDVMSALHDLLSQGNKTEDLKYELHPHTQAVMNKRRYIPGGQDDAEAEVI